MLAAPTECAAAGARGLRPLHISLCSAVQPWKDSVAA